MKIVSKMGLQGPGEEACSPVSLPWTYPELGCVVTWLPRVETMEGNAAKKNFTSFGIADGRLLGELHGGSPITIGATQSHSNITLVGWRMLTLHPPLCGE